MDISTPFDPKDPSSGLLKLKIMIEDDIRDIKSQSYEARDANNGEYLNAKWLERTMISKKEKRERVKRKLKRKMLRKKQINL